jgi:hypothetical protein
MTLRQRQLERLASALLAEGPRTSGFVEPRSAETIAFVPCETENDRFRNERWSNRKTLQEAFDQLGGSDRRRLIDRYKLDRTLDPFLDWTGWLSKNL